MRHLATKIASSLFVLSLTSLPSFSADGNYISLNFGVSNLGEAQLSNSTRRFSYAYESENNVFGSFALGTNFSDNLHGEIELSFRNYDNLLIRNDSGSIIIDSELSNRSILANIFYDFTSLGFSNQRFIPFLMGGVGLSILDLESNNKELTGIDQVKSDDSALVFQLGAGFEYKLENRHSLILGYRYFSTQDSNLGNIEITDQTPSELYLGYKVPLGR